MRKDALFQQMITIFCVQPLTNFVQPRNNGLSIDPYRES
jgi:hypothetical protein